MTTADAPLPFALVDDHDRALAEQVRPAGWRSPRPHDRYDLIAVGGGTAGLVAAMGAAALGARAALIERHLLGGDCLNTGCVPSKALLRAARAAHEARQAGRFGVHTDVRVKLPGALAWAREARAQVAPHDAAARIAAAGVHVFFGSGRFIAPDAIEVDGQQLRFKRALIASGARPSVPPIPGLQAAGYLTNETVFSLNRELRRLAILGAGPVGCELAQAFGRLGVAVTLIDVAARVLPRDDRQASALIARVLAAEGITLQLGARVERVEVGADKRLYLERAGERAVVAADEILVAAGRTPNVEQLGLQAAGVAFEPTGVVVDARLRTSNPRIFAAGDVCSELKLTHAADAMARVALQNALFPLRKRHDAATIPWCTYTDPEVAHVGLSAEQAERAGHEVLHVDMKDNDRAIAERDTAGFARVSITRRGRIVGATLVAGQAGELIGELGVAMRRGLPIGALAASLRPYPTRAEIVKALGDAYSRRRLTPRARALLKRYFAWTR